MLPALLVVTAALSDAAGAHSLARITLLAALPLAAVAAIAAFGECLDERPGALSTTQAVLSGLIVALLVASCALRSDAVAGVPQIAISSLFAALALFALKGALALAPYLGRLAELRPAKP
jgi:hypothetical protein